LKLGEKIVELTPLKSREWLRELKVAVVTEDKELLLSLAEGELPEFHNREEMVEAQNLIREALIFLVNFRHELGTSMEKVEANIKNIKSSMNIHSSFDKKI
jgi:hypothetical protein